MRYPYKCHKCQHDWEVIKSIAQIDSPEVCPKCASGNTERYIARTHFYGAAVEDSYFCPALGCIVKGKKHRNELANRNGLIEVGNEKPETIHKYHDAIRKEKEKKHEQEMHEITERAIGELTA